MSDRALTTLAKAAMALAQLPLMAILVEFEELDLRITNLPENVTIGGVTYTGAKQGHDWLIELEGLSETIEFDVPTCVLTLKNMDGYFGAMSVEDSFRGERVTITLLYMDTSNVWQSTGWVTTYAIDSDEMDADGVRLRLTTADAVVGTELPRRATQQFGCQHDFQRGGCYFRWSAGVSTVLKECDHGYDTPNGCKAHFPDLVDPDTGVTIQQPKPYGGFLGGVDHSIVRV